MITIDSSVLLRYLLNDVASQSQAVDRFFELRLSDGEIGFIPLIVIHEVHWVLTRQHKLDTDRVKSVLSSLLETAALEVEHENEVRKALAARVGFADALLHEVGRARGATHTVTFDRKFASLPGVELLADA